MIAVDARVNAWRRRLLAGVLGPIIACPAAGHAIAIQEPQEPARFRSTVAVARIAVSVADADGEFVDGFGVEDLTLRVNKTPREILDVLSVDARSAGASGRRLDQGATLRTGPAVSPGRRFILLFDLSTGSPGPRHLTPAFEAASKFLEIVQPHDQVAVMIGHATVIKTLAWFTRDRAIVREALDMVRELGLGRTRLRSRVAERGFLPRRGAIAALAGLPQALQDIVGAWTHVLFFSRGDEDRAWEVDISYGQFAVTTAASLREARIVVHAFQAEALPPPDVNSPSRARSRLRIDELDQERRGQISRAHASDRTKTGRRGFPRLDIALGRLMNRASFEYLAAETGGTTTYHEHMLDHGIAAVERRSRFYYLISFGLLPDDGPTIAVEVRSNRPGVQVTWAPVEVALGEGPRSEKRR